MASSEYECSEMELGVIVLRCYSLVFSGQNVENIFMFSSFITEHLKSGLNQWIKFFFQICRS